MNPKLKKYLIILAIIAMFFTAINSEPAHLFNPVSLSITFIVALVFTTCVYYLVKEVEEEKNARPI